MDQQQTEDPTQLLTWLDEQHREDRRQLVELRKLAVAQSRRLEDLTERFGELERQLTNTQAQFVTFSGIEDALQTLKSEIIGVLEERESRLQEADGRLESQLEAQAPKLTNLAKVLQETQRALNTLENRVEAMPAHIENQMEQATVLARDIEELEKRFNRTQARLTELGNRLSNQTDSATALARQLERLESRLSNTRAQLVKFPQLEGAIQETRDELVFMIKEIEEERRKEARESAQLRESELKDIQTALDNIRKRLEPIPQLDERIQALAAEDKRLRDLIVKQAQGIPPLRESLTEHQERISYLEENQPRTSHRIDKLEVKFPPIYETIDAQAGKIEFLEEWAQRIAEKIDEYKRFEAQMEKWRAALTEEIRQGEQHRDRRLNDWEKALAEHAEIIDEWRETLRRYELAHHENRRKISELETLPERLERDRAQLAEKQRLAEELLQRELVAWQEENEKRWRLFLKRRDYDWEQQAKRDAEQDDRFEPLEAWCDEHTTRFIEELDRLDENNRRILKRIVSLTRYLEQVLDNQIKQRTKQRDLLDQETQSFDEVLITRSPTHQRADTVQRLNKALSNEEG